MEDITRKRLGRAVLWTGVLAVSSVVLGCIACLSTAGPGLKHLGWLLLGFLLFLVFGLVAVVIAVVAAIMARVTPSSVVSIAALVAGLAESIPVVLVFRPLLHGGASADPAAYLVAALAAAGVALISAMIYGIMARATPSSVVSITAKVAVVAASLTVGLVFSFFSPLHSLVFSFFSPLHSRDRASADPAAYLWAALAATGVALISAMISGCALLGYKKDPQGHLPKQKPEENTSTREV